MSTSRPGRSIVGAARLGRAVEVTIIAAPEGTVWVGGATNAYFRGTALI
ncbi:hypothetical protein ACFOVU_16800 [Nocardiopsis sediminis]|uniref:PhzF family phenazine biosynthesis protein n=1 Tax=Nocardiopsis sediminis TaxID=1778267 RepID=A0ABV8FNH9_9ACTN